VGARAARITRDELLTPPEFRGLHPAVHQAARVGGARIELVRVGDETRLGRCYQQVPVRLMPPFVVDSEPASLLYLINLTAGLMDGDGHLIEITARSGTRAVVTGQSATRVHPAVASYATQQWTVDVEDDACLVVLPGPVIPFRGSRYFQRGRVELAPRSRLIWGDIWLAGRYDRGELSERFQFERIVQDFEARRGGLLVYRDRFRWDGPWDSDAAEWYTGGGLATGSLFVAGPVPEALPDAAPSVRRSVFRLDSGDSCVRWCGPPPAVTSDLVSIALSQAAGWTVKTGALPWLLASSGLAPNHWFSTPVAGISPVGPE
jgi:urease accessory protein